MIKITIDNVEQLTVSQLQVIKTRLESPIRKRIDQIMFDINQAHHGFSLVVSTDTGLDPQSMGHSDAIMDRQLELLKAVRSRIENEIGKINYH